MSNTRTYGNDVALALSAEAIQLLVDASWSASEDLLVRERGPVPSELFATGDLSVSIEGYLETPVVLGIDAPTSSIGLAVPLRWVRLRIEQGDPSNGGSVLSEVGGLQATATLPSYQGDTTEGSPWEPAMTWSPASLRRLSDAFGLDEPTINAITDDALRGALARWSLPKIVDRLDDTFPAFNPELAFGTTEDGDPAAAELFIELFGESRLPDSPPSALASGEQLVTLLSLRFLFGRVVSVLSGIGIPLDPATFQLTTAFDYTSQITLTSGGLGWDGRMFAAFDFTAQLKGVGDGWGFVKLWFSASAEDGELTFDVDTWDWEIHVALDAEGVFSDLFFDLRKIVHARVSHIRTKIRKSLRREGRAVGEALDTLWKCEWTSATLGENGLRLVGIPEQRPEGVLTSGFERLELPPDEGMLDIRAGELTDDADRADVRWRHRSGSLELEALGGASVIPLDAETARGGIRAVEGAIAALGLPSRSMTVPIADVQDIHVAIVGRAGHVATLSLSGIRPGSVGSVTPPSVEDRVTPVSPADRLTPVIERFTPPTASRSFLTWKRGDIPSAREGASSGTVIDETIDRDQAAIDEAVEALGLEPPVSEALFTYVGVSRMATRMKYFLKLRKVRSANIMWRVDGESIGRKGYFGAFDGGRFRVGGTTFDWDAEIPQEAHAKYRLGGDGMTLEVESAIGMNVSVHIAVSIEDGRGLQLEVPIHVSINGIGVLRKAGPVGKRIAEGFDRQPLPDPDARMRRLLKALDKAWLAGLTLPPE